MVYSRARMIGVEAGRRTPPVASRSVNISLPGAVGQSWPRQAGNRPMMRGKPSGHATRERLHDWFRADIEAPLAQRVGGEKRLRLILLLAGVLALDSADKATIGAVVADLERSL